MAEKIAAAIQERYRQYTGASMPINVARQCAEAALAAVQKP